MNETTPRREQVLDMIREERLRQIEIYGTNDSILLGFGSRVSACPWLAPYSDDDASTVESTFRRDYEEHAEKYGAPTWMHLIREEVAELFESHNGRLALEEAVQVAALCVSLSEQLLEFYGEVSE